jgi:hypothetical protein
MYWAYFIIDNTCSLLDFLPRLRPAGPSNLRVSSILRTTKSQGSTRISIPTQASLRSKGDSNMANKLELGELLTRMETRYTTHTHHRELELCAMMGQRVLRLVEELVPGMEA